MLDFTWMLGRKSPSHLPPLASPLLPSLSRTVLLLPLQIIRQVKVAPSVLPFFLLRYVFVSRSTSLWRRRRMGWTRTGIEGEKSVFTRMSFASLRFRERVQRCEKRLVNLVKQDPARVRQNS